MSYRISCFWTCKSKKSSTSASWGGFWLVWCELWICRDAEELLGGSEVWPWSANRWLKCENEDFLCDCSNKADVQSGPWSENWSLIIAKKTYLKLIKLKLLQKKSVLKLLENWNTKLKYSYKTYISSFLLGFWSSTKFRTCTPIFCRTRVPIPRGTNAKPCSR